MASTEFSDTPCLHTFINFPNYQHPTGVHSLQLMKNHKVWGPSDGWIALEFLTLRPVLTELTEKSIVSFLYRDRTGCSNCHLFSSYFDSACLSLPFGGLWFALLPCFAHRSKKSYSFFSFYLLDGIATSHFLTFSTRNQKSDSLFFKLGETTVFLNIIAKNTVERENLVIQDNPWTK